MDFSRWEFVRPGNDEACAPLGILFVGGDFDRKGGPLLLEAIRRLRMDPHLPNSNCTSVLIQPGDVDALEGALSQLVADPAHRRRLGDGAHDLARRQHDARANATRIVTRLIELGTDLGQDQKPAATTS